MSEQNNGGPAFPAPQFAVPSDMPREQIVKLKNLQGMTLRDYFAAKALPGVYAEFWRTTDHCPPDWELGLAADTYRMADAMLKMRQAT